MDMNGVVVAFLISLFLNIVLIFVYFSTKKIILSEKEKTENQKKYLEMFVHDMKNPLSAVKTALEIARDEEINERERKKYLNIALDSVNRVFTMILNALDIAKYSGKTFKIKKEPTDLPNLVEEARETFQIAIELEKKEIVFYPPQSFDTVYIDREIIKRVLENLIANSLKYTEKGKGRIEISVSMDKEKNFFEIKLIDNGQGMEEVDLEKIFEEFVQLNPVFSKNELNKGIGLAFCKLAVEAHGGEIKVNSKKGVGTVFIVKLPVK